MFTLLPRRNRSARKSHQPSHLRTYLELFQKLDALFGTVDFRLHANESLGGAVRVPTETRDEEKPPGEDPDQWRPFEELHSYLKARFPLIHSDLTVTKVNSFALIFHWQGTNTSLNPILLTSHQDVVPVEPETASQWIHPPFSGFYDGEYIWGRGSCDDKSGLIASLIAVETLLSIGFEPERSIILAMGVDEERGGAYGATAIRDHLLDNFGKNTVYPCRRRRYQPLAVTLAGHPPYSSVSTPASSSENPHPTHLRRNGTFYQQIQCLAEQAPSFPESLRKLAKASPSDDEALSELAAELEKLFPEYAPSTGTTQAVHIIQGGVKSNTLSEQVSAIVNHRIADYSSASELERRFTSIVSPLAREYSLTIDAFGDEESSIAKENAYGHLVLSDAYDSALNPAPISPTFGNAWELLSGSILYAFATNQRSTKPVRTFAVAPGLSLGNTDTRFYWDLTKHIFRYGHLGVEDRYNGAHTVNEAVRAEGFLELIRFFTVFILNAGQTDLIE